ncbi:ATP-binding protein [Corallococcus carmarthensis]|uniref:ATP-binding protein n=1 Tax=Corallococcus carmarthensis TaxID=2316728 RepID=UPI00148D8FB5|nr:ATP-binding protein [Corallococcus carmarthensis]NOK20945.1 ATP-binding protein [Corallococcus carmarthensis]
MRYKSLPPFAPVLLESMRAIGYDTAAAVADLIDNSITAKATRVLIRFDPGVPRAVAFLDDGRGMDEEELAHSMRHGSRSPNDVRPDDDLGRFGLGLKTASMSQCRKLTVVTRKDGRTHGMMWDLDLVERKGDWVAGVLDPGDIDSVPFVGYLQAQEHGTLVVWEKLDRLAAGDAGDGALLSERIRRVEEHLALVFHRHLTGRPPRLIIEINNYPVEPLDPFLEDEGAMAGPEERIFAEGQRVVLRAFTLPHISRLTRAQIEKAGGEAGLRRQQGFYVYRNQRLIVWGTWFRLFRQEELTKLTRVRVDVPNALDHLWSLDIKKSAASPPAVIRDRLRGLVPTMVRPSQTIHAYRGRVTGSDRVRPIWKRIEDRDGVRYEIDWDHPVVAALRLSAEDGHLSEIDNVLRAISGSLPVEAIYNDRANERIGLRKESDDGEAAAAHLEELARQLLSAFADRPTERERLLAGLGNLEPFALYPSLVERLQRKLSL